MLIIALHGPMGAGKSTIASRIIERCNASGKKAIVLPFAKPLKDAARQLGWNGEKDVKGRRLLQLLGTQVGRECISNNIWVDKWMRAVSDAELDYDVVICDDLRFLNEYEAAKAFNLSRQVIAVKIKGRGTQTKGILARLWWNLKRLLGLLHASERPLPDYLFDEIFVNDKSFYHVDAFIEKLFYRVK